MLRTPKQGLSSLKLPQKLAKKKLCQLRVRLNKVPKYIFSHSLEGSPEKENKGALERRGNKCMDKNAALTAQVVSALDEMQLRYAFIVEVRPVEADFRARREASLSDAPRLR